MNILLITPGINKKFNDNFHSYKLIANLDNRIFAVSNRENINKGGRTLIENEFDNYDDLGRFTVFRPFSKMKEQHSVIKQLIYFNKIVKEMDDFKPDVIFCEEINNLFISILFKYKFKIPIVFRSEFVYDKNNIYRTMGRLLKKFKLPLVGDFIPKLLNKLIWRIASHFSDSIITCYHGDLEKLPYLYNTPLYYVPWPTYISKNNYCDFQKQDRVIFIGAFDHHKNLEEFLVTIPLIFEYTPLKELIVVGAGDYDFVIDDLKTKFPDKVTHYVNKSRHECLELIGSSFLSYSSATRGGWGFIGDSWAMRTPLFVSSNHYNFNDKIDCIFVNPDNIAEKINILHANPDLYESLCEGGWSRFNKNHDSDAVGRKFLEIINSTIIDI